MTEIQIPKLVLVYEYGELDAWYVTSQSVMVVKQNTGITTLYSLSESKGLFWDVRKKTLSWI